jgi:hypothetical protein
MHPRHSHDADQVAAITLDWTDFWEKESATRLEMLAAHRARRARCNEGEKDWKINTRVTNAANFVLDRMAKRYGVRAIVPCHAVTYINPITKGGEIRPFLLTTEEKRY